MKVWMVDSDDFPWTQVGILGKKNNGDVPGVYPGGSIALHKKG